MTWRTYRMFSLRIQRESIRNMAKCYLASLIMHLGLLALILAFTMNRVESPPPVSIDFTLSTCPVSDRPREKAKQLAVSQQPVTAQPPAPLQQEQARAEPQPIPAVIRNAAPEPSAPTAPTPSAPPGGNAVTENITSPSSSTLPSSTVTYQGAAESREEVMTPAKARQRYLKEHFTYIRDLIIKRLTYPQMARRMGWSGRVVLAFVVAEDGTVRSIHVKESSGYTLLDNSAVQTIKNVAPFPRPPVAAEIVMPVLFRLQ